jgi:hypothetical protein
MSKKNWLLLALAVALGGLSLYLNKDWFAKDGIHIYHRSRPMRSFMLFGRKRQDTSLVDPIIFGFDRKVRLKSVKVIPLADIQTNKFPHPIWYLLSDSNSLPVKDFSYGAPIPGMRPAVKGAVADPLQPDVEYRLLVEANDFKGQHDFAPIPRSTR